MRDSKIVEAFKIGYKRGEKFIFEGRVYTLTRTERSANNLNIHLFFEHDKTGEEQEVALFAFYPYKMWKDADGCYHIEAQDTGD